MLEVFIKKLTPEIKKLISASGEPIRLVIDTEPGYEPSGETMLGILDSLNEENNDSEESLDTKGMEEDVNIILDFLLDKHRVVELELQLGNSSLPLTLAKKLGNLVTENKKISRLDIDGGIFEYIPCQVLADALQYNNTLKDLVFRASNWTYASCLGVITRALIDNKSLINLSFLGFQNKKDAWYLQHIAELMEKNTTIDTLHLGGFEFYKGAAKKLGNCTAESSSFRALSLFGCSFPLNVFEDFCDEVKQNPKLEKLDLSYSNIANAGAYALAKVLSNGSMLNELILTDCSIDERGVIELFKSLVTNRTLCSLSLSRNDTGSKDEVLQVLGHLLANNTTLAHLDLSSHNELRGSDIPSFSVEAIKFLCEGLSKNRTLESLSLKQNSLQTKSLVSIVHSLGANNSLKRLELGGNEATDEVTMAIAVMLRENKSLEYLSLSGFTTNGAQDLTEALEFNETLLELEGVDEFPDEYRDRAYSYLKRNQSKKSSQSSVAPTALIKGSTVMAVESGLSFFDIKASSVSELPNAGISSSPNV